MAAGVGKTYRMLQEGQAEAEAGRDVVVGLLETHGRAETAALAEGLEVIPRRRVELPRHDARGDGPAGDPRARARAVPDRRARPHQRARASSTRKRYEDIADVLAAGIDVFSTVNVQHLESLNDQVAELTGVRVRETLPDEVLGARRRGRADRPDARGADRPPARGQGLPAADACRAALNGFFKVENLQALREVALRQVAEDVEAKRLVRDTLDVREERLFGIGRRRRSPSGCSRSSSSTPSAERVVRRAWRSSQRLGAELDILVVRDPEHEPSAAEREQLEAPAPARLGARRAPARRGGRGRRARRRAASRASAAPPTS